MFADPCSGTRKKAREKCRGLGKGRDTGGEIGDVAKRRAGRNDRVRSQEKRSTQE